MEERSMNPVTLSHCNSHVQCGPEPENGRFLVHSGVLLQFLHRAFQLQFGGRALGLPEDHLHHRLLLLQVLQPCPFNKTQNTIRGSLHTKQTVAI